MFKSTIIALALSLLQVGCTSMQRIDTTPEDLQAQIREGKYLSKGQEVTIFTNQRKELWFRFQRIENDTIVGTTQRGEEASIPISDVARLTTDRVNVGRTTAVVGGGIVASVAIAIALILATGPVMMMP